MKNIIFFLVVIVCLKAYGQVSIFQDSGGDTSFLSGNSGILINAADSNIAFSISNSVSGKKNRGIGASLKFKANNGFVNIINGKELDPEYEIQVSYTKPLSSSDKSTTQSLYVLLSGNSSRFNLFDENTIGFEKESFTGFSLAIGYNKLSSTKFLSSKDIDNAYVLGVALNFGRFNNIDDLKQIDAYKTAVNDEEIIFLSDKETGFKGDYKASYNLNFLMDCYLFPKSILAGRFGFGGYVRSRLTGHNPKNDLGIGITIGQKGAPSNVVLSVAYQFGDVFNQLDNNKGLIERSGLNIITGYKF